MILLRLSFWYHCQFLFHSDVAVPQFQGAPWVTLWIYITPVILEVQHEPMQGNKLSVHDLITWYCAISVHNPGVPHAIFLIDDHPLSSHFWCKISQRANLNPYWCFPSYLEDIWKENMKFWEVVDMVHWYGPLIHPIIVVTTKTLVTITWDSVKYVGLHMCKHMHSDKLESLFSWNMNTSVVSLNVMQILRTFMTSTHAASPQFIYAHPTDAPKVLHFPGTFTWASGLFF